MTWFGSASKVARLKLRMWLLHVVQDSLPTNMYLHVELDPVVEAQDICPASSLPNKHVLKPRGVQNL